MQRAGIIICRLSVLLIVLLLLKPVLQPLLHLRYISPWKQNEAIVQRYLQLAFLVPFTLLGTLQRRRPGSQVVIVVTTLTVMGGLIYLATRDLDNELPYQTKTVKELFQNNSDPGEKIVLEAENGLHDSTLSRQSILRVKPFSSEMQIVHMADTNHLEAGKWKRIY